MKKNSQKKISQKQFNARTWFSEFFRIRTNL